LLLLSDDEQAHKPASPIDAAATHVPCFQFIGASLKLPAMHALGRNGTVQRASPILSTVSAAFGSRE
jgi:hypothetical protein